MAKEFSKPFYHSKAWQDCRDSYIRSVGGLCENCLKQGRVVPGEELHHKIELTPMNITNPEISLSWDNLIYLCHACHDAEHERYQKRKKRFFVDENGVAHTLPGTI